MSITMTTPPTVGSSAWANTLNTCLNDLSTNGTSTSESALKAPLASPTFTGNVTLNSTVSGTAISNTNTASKLLQNDTSGQIRPDLNITTQLDGEALINKLENISHDSSYYFNGTSAYGSIEDSANLSFTNGINDRPFSVVFKIKNLNLSASATYSTKGSYSSTLEYIFGISSTGKVSITLTNPTYTNRKKYETVDSMTSGNSYTIAIVYDGLASDSSMSIYINGKLSAITNTNTGSYTCMTNGAGILGIGCLIGDAGNAEFSKSSFIDFKIFNRVLTQAEVRKYQFDTLDFADIGANNTNLVTNGGFDSTTTGWSTSLCTISSIAGGVSGNCLELTATSGTSQYFTQTLATVIGKKYIISLYAKSGSSGNEAFRIAISGVSDNYFTTTENWVKASVEFTATTTSQAIYIAKNTATLNKTMLFDEVSCYQVGCVLDLNDKNMTDGVWYDASGNSLNATMYNTTLQNANPYRKTNIIERQIIKAGVADNVATGIFTISTTNESGNIDGGSYACIIDALITHPGSAGTSAQSTKYWRGTFNRSMEAGGTGVNSAVEVMLSSASSATSAGTRDIGTITVTVTETSEYIQTVNFQVDTTGSSATTYNIIADVKIIRGGFSTELNIINL